MCSAATNPVTWLDFNPIRCATTLCHFERTRNTYVATNFILLSSTVESIATSGYVVVPERYSQNEEPAGINKEWARKKHVFVPNMKLFDAIVFPKHVILFAWLFDCFLFHFAAFLFGKNLTFVYVIIHCVEAGISTLMSISNGWDPYTRSSKKERDVKVFICHPNRHFSSKYFDYCTFLFLYLKLACKHCCFLSRNRRNESFNNII